MKRTFIIALAIAAVSCAKTGVGENAPLQQKGEKISFGMSGAKAFVETTEEQIKTDTAGFRFMALFNGDKTSYIDNVNAAYVDSLSCYRPKGKDYYYVEGKPLDFYAVYPEMKITVDGGTAKLPDYNAGEADLVAALTPDQSGGRAVMTFYHLLNRVTVEVKGTDSEVKYRLDSCTITYNASGDYTFAEQPTNSSWGNCKTDSVKFNSREIVTATKLLENKVILPGDASVRVTLSWTTIDKASGAVVAQYKDISHDFNAMIGKMSLIKCNLKNGAAKPIEFEVIVKPWEDAEDQEWDFEN